MFKGSTVPPRKSKQLQSGSSSPEMDSSTFALFLIEAFKDSEVVSRMKEAITIDCDKVADIVSTRIQPYLKKIEGELEEKNKMICMLQKRVTELESKQDDLEQYSRRSTIRINGVEESPQEDVLAKTKDILTTLGLPDAAINRAHRVGPKRAKNNNHLDTSSLRPRPIICQFLRYQDKADVMKRAKILKGTMNAVFINEDLTRSRSRLLFRCRLLKRSKKILDCWSHDGRLLIKDCQNKILPVRDADDLKQFGTGE